MNTIVLCVIMFMSDKHAGAILDIRHFDTSKACIAELKRAAESDDETAGKLVWRSDNFNVHEQLTMTYKCISSKKVMELKDLEADF